ncbi:MAG: hypothetical protein N2110_05020 [Flavobacteriales bacterium]|nr:hypothetical protein [Flavobacteriales bacterium]
MPYPCEPITEERDAWNTSDRTYLQRPTLPTRFGLCVHPLHHNQKPLGLPPYLAGSSL